MHFLSEVSLATHKEVYVACGEFDRWSKQITFQQHNRQITLLGCVGLRCIKLQTVQVTGLSLTYSFAVLPSAIVASEREQRKKK